MLMNENKLILLEYVPYYAILIGKCRVQLNNKLHILVPSKYVHIC